MKIKTKHNKKLRCSSSTIISILVGCVFTIHLIMLYTRKDSLDLEESLSSQKLLVQHPIIRELEQVEEENIQMPPPRKRSPRAIKRKPKRPTTLIEEFLDENSQIRHLFFPDMKSAFGPTKDMGNDSMYYFPGRIWLDTEGNPIQAHGGGILYDERSSTYYWYGENKDGPTYHAYKDGPARVDIIGVSCYSSKDLYTWKNEGLVLTSDQTNETHDLHKSKILERPKVIHNTKTQTYIMYMHIDDSNYTKASIGVAISPSPTGPFTYLYSKQPHSYDSRDMTIFKDNDQSQTAYLIYSSEDNSVLHISSLTQDYLDVEPTTKRIMIGEHREAPILFKYRKVYYMITSGCTGWAPNEALVYVAESVMGKWEKLGNPCNGGNKVFRMSTYFSQGSYVIALPGVNGGFIFMADRWNPGDLGDSRYVWLPLIVGGAIDRPVEGSFEFPMWSRVSVYWHRKWKLPLAL